MHLVVIMRSRKSRLGSCLAMRSSDSLSAFEDEKLHRHLNSRWCRPYTLFYKIETTLPESIRVNYSGCLGAISFKSRLISHCKLTNKRKNKHTGKVETHSKSVRPLACSNRFKVCKLGIFGAGCLRSSAFRGKCFSICRATETLASSMKSSTCAYARALKPRILRTRHSFQGHADTPGRQPPPE